MSYTLDALKDDIRRELSHGSPAQKRPCAGMLRGR